MEFSYTIAVLIIPVCMFLFLGLAGMKLSKKFAGILGTCAMGITTVIAYSIALTYFFGTDQGQIIDGIRQPLQVMNFTWLQFTENLVIKMGFSLILYQP